MEGLIGFRMFLCLSGKVRELGNWKLKIGEADNVTSNSRKSLRSNGLIAKTSFNFCFLILDLDSDSGLQNHSFLEFSGFWNHELFVLLRIE